MNSLISLHNTIVGRVFGSGNSDWLITTIARFVFAAVLLRFFWTSAVTKLDGIFSPSVGAYAQIFPKKFESVGYDPSQMSFLDTLIVIAGTYGEFILPFLVVVGLLTRLSSLGMIGFIFVMSIVDITGHNADASTIGMWFDRHSGSLILDQRLFWVMLLVTLILKGGGPISVDRLLRIK